MTLSTKLDFPVISSRRRVSARSAGSDGGPALRDLSIPSVNLHKLSDVQTIDIGDGTSVWQYVVILPNSKIGRNCNICSHVFIENDCVIVDEVTIKNNVMVFDGVEIERGATFYKWRAKYGGMQASAASRYGAVGQYVES